MKKLVPRLVGALIAGVYSALAQAQTPPAPMVAPLPTSFVTTTDLLFADGMSDPRGGTYRAIKVRVGNVWSSRSDVVTTHGWVLPTPNRAGVRRAVAWNGLTYDIVAEAGPADLKADVARLIPDNREGLSKRKDEAPLFSRYPETSEAGSLDAGNLLPLKACLLLRAGETALAARVYRACERSASSRLHEIFDDKKDPLEYLAADWTWAAFDRAVCAHKRGDDHLALDDTKLLSVAGPKLEAQVTARGTAPRVEMGKKRPHFEFLAPVPQLLADSRRRIDASETPLDDKQAQRTLSTLKSTPERITFLVRHLDDVAADQMGQPGGVLLDSDLICDDLIAEGDAAVDPLLDVVENDTRLTRSVGFWRDFARSRNLLTVRSVAAFCVTRILQTRIDAKDDADFVRKMRVYWKENRGIPITERWYRTLANDAASPRQWVEAAGNIVRSSDNYSTGGWMPSLRSTLDSNQPMDGESLRGRTPTVSGLLVQRVAEIAGVDRVPTMDGDFADFSPQHVYADGITLGLALAQWDLKASRPTLKLLMQRLRQVHPVDASQDNFDRLGNLAAKLTIARVRAGDPEAADDYAAFLRDIPPARYSFTTGEALLALRSLPRDPALARVADAVFNDPNSAWNPLADPSSSAAHKPLGQEELIHSSLLCVPAFRRQVLRELDDRRQIGTATIDQHDSEVRLKSREGERQCVAQQWDADGPWCAPDGQPYPIRLCDFYAYQLNQVRSYNAAFGVPRFELYWPQPQRDRAILAVKAYLARFGDRFAIWGETKPLHDFFSSEDFHLLFPPLKNPATDDDVRAGRAIFALGNPLARLAPLSRPLPVPAVRLTGDAHQIEQAHLLLSGKIKWGFDTPLPWTRGMIYQAEEVREGGKWQRYYGFVGPHTIERVPAEEIVPVDDHDNPFPRELPPF